MGQLLVRTLREDGFDVDLSDSLEALSDERRLAGLGGFRPAFPEAAFVNEFPVRVEAGDGLLSRLQEVGILGGLPVGRWFPELEGVLVFCCTELNDPGAIETLLEACGK